MNLKQLENLKLGWNISHKKGKIVSYKTKKLISDSNKGKHYCSLETRKKMSISAKIRGIKPPSRLGIHHTDKTKKKLSKSHKGIIPYIISESTREKMRNNMLGKTGSKSPAWRGGITPKNNIIRGSDKYRIWEKVILKRDIICKKCKEKRICKLTVHHIKNFAQYPELRFDIDNGILLCRNCHKEFHHKYGKKNNSIEQVKEFIGDKNWKNNWVVCSKNI